MAKMEKRLFELDRRMELRLRLAAKKASDKRLRQVLNAMGVPDRELVDRLIARVREL